MSDESNAGIMVDYIRRTVTVRNGVLLHLNTVSPLILERIHSDQTGKPVVPKVTVVIAGQHEHEEPNPMDPAYLEELEDWKRNKGVKVMKYLFTHGVQNDPPAEFVEEHKEFFPESTFRDIKYLWVASLVGEVEDDLTKLIEVITGQTSVTEAGLQKAEESFPGDSGRNGHSVLPVEQTTSPAQLQPGI